MAYEPTEWKSGDVITSAKLNKIEQGVAAGGGVVVPKYTTTDDGDTYTCNMTFSEIWTACLAGNCINCCNVSVEDEEVAVVNSMLLEFASSERVIFMQTALVDGSPKFVSGWRIIHESDETISSDEITASFHS